VKGIVEELGLGDQGLAVKADVSKEADVSIKQSPQ
jgi:hypothetical protein